MATPLLACMLAVSTALSLPPRVLQAIQAVEGGRIGVARTNANGSEDLGLMQINSLWLPVLARQTGLSQEGVRDKLLGESCFNVAVSGAIIRLYLRQTQGDLLAAIGNYHSRTPVRHEAYKDKVIGAAIRLFEAPVPGRKAGSLH